MDDLLFLCHRIPFPPNKGDKIRSFHTLDHLAKEHRIHLGCFHDDPGDAQYIGELERRCASLLCLPLGPMRARFKSLAGRATGRSLTEVYYRDARLERWISDIARRHRLDAAYIFGSAMAPYAFGLQETRRIFDMVDLDSDKWRAYAASKPWPFSWLYARERKHLFELERRAAAVFDRTLMVSAAEADLLRRAAPEIADRVLALSNGVDTEYFDPDLDYPNPFPPGKRPIVFTGAMDYWPNVQAVEWFVETVLPRIQSEKAEIEFWIVGGNPIRAVRRLSEKPGVRATGRVEDMRPYLAHAAAAVAPLRIARGIQNKVLEAMSMAKPVVATPQAAEGIIETAGVELLVCSGPSDFARGVLAVLDGDGSKLGPRARTFVQKRFRWHDRYLMLDALFECSKIGVVPAKLDLCGPVVER